MSKKAPTLADALIREWLRPQYRQIDPDNAFVRRLAEARKFVLDDEMSAFCADLAWASLKTCDTPYKAQLLMDGMRTLARLPYPTTWIELSLRARATRAISEYNSPIDIEGGIPERVGWLLMQHPQLETAFMAVECVSHSWSKTDVREETPQPNVCAMQWRCEDGSPPWPTIFEGDLRIPYRGDVMVVAAYLTGVASYRNNNVSLTASPFASHDIVRAYLENSLFDPRQEMASDARYLWSLLATINDLPTSYTEVRPDKGFVARGRYRKFVEHRVVHLHCPVRKYRTVAKRAIAIARRKAHNVRGHWRRDWKKPLTLGCAHDFEGGLDGATCRHCGGHRIWVRLHQRGDAGLGFVLHDYEMHHDEIG